MLGIIIPVYNEAENIKKVLPLLKKYIIYDFKIFLCYDMDEDNTLPIAIKICDEEKIDLVLVKNYSTGACEAIKTGLLCSQKSDVTASLVFPADDFYNISQINLLYEKFLNNKCHIVCADRLIGGNRFENHPIIPYIIIQITSFIIRYFTNLPTYDISSGFRLFSNYFLDSQIVESTDGFTYSIELLAKAYRGNWKIGWVPVICKKREHGKSRFKVFKWLPYYIKWLIHILITEFIYKRRNSG